METSTITAAVTQSSQAVANPKAPKKGAKKGEEQSAEFNSALISAQPLAANARAQVAVQPKGEGAEKLRITNAERSPLAHKQAVSLNTAAAITGPKPWDREWVFTGTEQTDPELKPLIPSQTPAGKDLTQVMAALEAARRAMPEGIQKGSEAAPTQAPKTSGAKEGTAQQGPAQSASVPGATSPSMLDPIAMAMAAEMGGEVLSVEGESPAPGKGAQRLTLAGGGMSGSEFVTALNGAQGRPNLGQNGGESGGQGNGQSGRGKGSQALAAAAAGELGASGPRRGLTDRLEEPFSLNRPRDAIAPNVLAMHSGVVTNNDVARNLGLATGPQEMTGHVVKGRMATDRLSSQSLLGLSTGIKGMTATGGGEMKVRLNPQNLGELHVRVLTQGNQVGLEIRASNDRAKAILEESMSHLRESLAGQQLSLAKIDLAVGQPGQSTGNGMNNGQGGDSNWNQSQQWNMDAQSGQGRSHSGGERWESSAPGESQRQPASLTLQSGLSSMSQRVAGASRAGSGRLDVMA